jgi:hypothetical protein
MAGNFPTLGRLLKYPSDWKQNHPYAHGVLLYVEDMRVILVTTLDGDSAACSAYPPIEVLILGNNLIYMKLADCSLPGS